MPERMEKQKTFKLGPIGLWPFVHIDEHKGQLIVIESPTRNTVYELGQVTSFRPEVRGLRRRVALHVYVDGRLDHTLQARGINTRRVEQLNEALKSHQPTSALVTELERLATLHKTGALTDEQFERAKSIALA